MKIIITIPDNDIDIKEFNEVVQFVKDKFNTVAIVSKETAGKTELNLAKINLDFKKAKYKVVEPYDKLFPYALEILLLEQQVGASVLQRTFGIGYARAAEIKDKIVADNLVIDKLPNTQKILETLKLFS